MSGRPAAALEHGARCLRCSWTATGADADRLAERHTKDTQHGTMSTATARRTSPAPERPVTGR